MKRFFALILSILLLAGCAAYDGPTETVWVLTEERTTLYNPATGEICSTSIDTISYDGFGNPVRTCWYTDGKLVDDTKRTFDDRGNCIREVVRNHFWIFSYPVSRTEYHFDDQGNYLGSTDRNGLGIKTGEAPAYPDDYQYHSYEENGITFCEDSYLDLYGTRIRSVSEYNEAGRHIRTTEYRDDALYSTTETRYDDQGRILEDITVDARGAVLTRSTYQHTENTTTIRDETGSTMVETFLPNGELERCEVYDQDGTLCSRTECTYAQIRIPAA